MSIHRNKPHPILIAGLGVAGACLYWQLRKLGANVVLADPNHTTSSSKAAAGLITPVTGATFALSWRFDEIWPESHEFYRTLAFMTGKSFFHAMPVVRLFTSDVEAVKFARKLADNRLLNTFVTDVFSAATAPADLLGRGIPAPYGGFIMRGGWVNTTTLIDETRRELIRSNSYREQSVITDEVSLTTPGNQDHPIRWNGETYDTIVFCEGANTRYNPLFADIPFRPAKGEFLSIKAPQASTKAIVNRKGSWLAPRGNDEWRAGSTYDFEQLDAQATPDGREQILANISSFYTGELHVTASSAGIRPIIRKSQPIAGFHPQHHGRVAILNGLGSKGCSTAPWAAAHLARAIVNGTPLPPYLDLAELSNNPV